jgi:hypothetical protein
LAYANATAVKAALDAGAKYSAGRLVVGGVTHYLLLQDGAWTLTTNPALVIYNKIHYEKMRDSPLISGGDYDQCFATPQGAYQLAAVTEAGVTKAKLIDP